MLEWFKSQHKAARLALTHSEKTSQFNAKIAKFSNTIFGDGYDFSPIVSLMTRDTEHEGVFTVAEEDVNAYMQRFAPTVLRGAVTTPVPEGIAATTFGLVKGLTFDRVVIFSTRPIETFLKDGSPLAPKSACGLYVGVTHATHSVAFVVAKPDKIALPQCKAEGNY